MGINSYTKKSENNVNKYEYTKSARRRITFDIQRTVHCDIFL